jgi:hypothetical protein
MPSSGNGFEPAFLTKAQRLDAQQNATAMAGTETVQD